MRYVDDARLGSWPILAFEHARSLLLIVCMLLSSIVAEGRALAQAAPKTEASNSAGASSISDADLRRARTLFQRGVQLAEKHQFGAAAKRFREALDVFYAPAVEYNLASALFETGQYGEAYNRTQNVLRQPSTPERVRERAERLERSLHPYVARLTVVTGGENGAIEVRVDEQTLSPELLGVPQAVSPGDHRVVALREGAPISTRDIQIPLRTAAIVDVNLLIAQQEAATRLEVSQAEERETTLAEGETDRPAQRAWTRDWRIWTGIGLGVAALAVGAGFLFTSRDGERQAPVSGDSSPGALTWK